MPLSDKQPIIELIINDTIIPAHDYLQSFEIVKKQGIWDGTIELFDPDWTNLEAIALERGTFNTIIKVNYGWEDQMSNWIQGTMQNYEPSFSADGISLRIDFMASAGSKARVRRSFNWKEDYKISDIVKQIANKNGWDCVVEETRGTFDRPFIQRDMSDLYFIKHVLCPRAINRDGIGGYKMLFEGNKLTFSTFITRNPNIYRSYIVQRGVDSEVQEFSPSDNVANIAQYGGKKIKVFGVDPLNKKVISSEFSSKNQSNIPTTGGFQSSPSDEEIVKTVKQKPFHRSEDVQNYAKLRYAEVNAHAYHASAVLLGDPHIPVFGSVEFIVLTTSGITHYLSGTYRVEEITDRIENGNFTSTLNLYRASVSKGSETIKAIEQQIVRTPTNRGLFTIEAESE